MRNGWIVGSAGMVFSLLVSVMAIFSLLPRGGTAGHAAV
jgi:hypothetical protein